jgi:hypothetical protein
MMLKGRIDRSAHLHSGVKTIRRRVSPYNDRISTEDGDSIRVPSMGNSRFGVKIEKGYSMPIPVVPFVRSSSP